LLAVPFGPSRQRKRPSELARNDRHGSIQTNAQSIEIRRKTAQGS
jgi:hypothetical protein